MISNLKEFVALFDTKKEAAKALGVNDAHLSMALKRNNQVFIEHNDKQVVWAKIRTVRDWGRNANT
jgi:hypothetical protein